MKLLKFTIIKLTLCLIIGVLIAHFLKGSLWPSFFITIALIISSGLYSFAIRHKLKKDIVFGILAFLATISLGVVVYNIHYQPNFTNHYTKRYDWHDSLSVNLRVKVFKILKPSTYYDKYLVKLISMNNETTTGRLLLNVVKDSITTYNIDDVLIAKTTLSPIAPPINPGQFNYKSYLEKQYIYHQIYVEPQELLQIESKNHTLYGFASQFRKLVNDKLKSYHFKAQELAIINALLLGQRQDIDKETYNNYSNAGAIHILAVSGLHVGIILVLLQFLLKPLLHFKHGRIIRIITILILLWCYAVVAGLSASVTRAVTMFSLVAIAINLKRYTNIYNTIAASIFLLLLFKPMFLFDVGFQLSYIAVLSIISIQPTLYKLWHPHNKILSFFWNLITVTLAAQIGVSPISIYYFHQFPGLFFISNLTIIPVLGLILGLGLFIIILALVDALPQVLASGYVHIIYLMNTFVKWVSAHESFIFRDISLNEAQLIAYYLLLLSIFLFFKHKTYWTTVAVLSAVIGIQLTYLHAKVIHSKNQFVIFHKSKHTLIGQKLNNNLILHHNLDSSSFGRLQLLKNYKTTHSIKNIKSDNIQPLYQWKNKYMMVVDSLGIYNIKGINIDYVLLRQSPKINLNRLIDSLSPKIIIADGSNYRTYIERWRQSCQKQKLRFHYTGKNGAFIIE